MNKKERIEQLNFILADPEISTHYRKIITKEVSCIKEESGFEVGEEVFIVGISLKIFDVEVALVTLEERIGDSFVVMSKDYCHLVPEKNLYKRKELAEKVASELREVRSGFKS